MCMFILWLSMVTRHINPFPQSLQWNLLSESAIWTPCIWCFTFFTKRHRFHTQLRCAPSAGV